MSLYFRKESILSHSNQDTLEKVKENPHLLFLKELVIVMSITLFLRGIVILFWYDSIIGTLIFSKSFSPLEWLITYFYFLVCELGFEVFLFWFFMIKSNDKKQTYMLIESSNYEN